MASLSKITEALALAVSPPFRAVRAPARFELLLVAGSASRTVGGHCRRPRLSTDSGSAAVRALTVRWCAAAAERGVLATSALSRHDDASRRDPPGCVAEARGDFVPALLMRGTSRSLHRRFPYSMSLVSRSPRHQMTKSKAPARLHAHRIRSVDDDDQRRLNDCSRRALSALRRSMHTATADDGGKGLVGGLSGARTDRGGR
jgi:hypothetical protein